MLIDDLEAKYIRRLQTLKKQGTKNKLILVLLMIPASVFAYYYVLPYYMNIPEKEKTSGNGLVVLVTLVSAFWMVIILISKSIHYINSNEIRYFKNEFKKQLFNFLKLNNPELQEYNYHKKIHPSVFYASSLFDCRYDDYTGDDWMKGIYNGITFEICELHVSRLFHPIFNGVFIMCHSHNIFSQQDRDDIMKHFLVVDFMEKHRAGIKIATYNGHVLIAIDMKGYFFENKSMASIDKLHKDAEMLGEMIGIIKMVISLKIR
jgi:hypothetical protein